MQLRTVYARFFRSLNFDYVRASDEDYAPDPWDGTPTGINYPFVRLRLERDVTTIVGGNESGKSQILGAVIGALTGEGYAESDFCRYSEFFDDGEMRLPEFGAVYDGVTSDDLKVLAAATQQPSLGPADRVALFRMNSPYKHRMYIYSKGNWSEPLNVKSPSQLRQIGVPAIKKIDADTPLPDTVPLEYLDSGKPVKQVSMAAALGILEKFRSNRSWFATAATVEQAAQSIAAEFSGTDALGDVDDATARQYKLAADLLFKVAGVDPGQVVQLRSAVLDNNGYAASIVDAINEKISRALNFPHWWSQDSQFELYVMSSELDLKFMIRDRTGKSYSFEERSDGMKYFLSYFVQYLAHEPAVDSSAEVLLMDEPDRYLSSSAQQDLLRIFEDFAHPRDPDRRALQVIYVTHSPFLIDKNDARRIRVVEKGELDEGTRLVASVAANHYEPLRSAFGSFVAETTFISGSNLVVEGPSDQVLLAGATRWLKREKVSERERLDLNSVTMVPAGGTDHVPYIVYLARGRDAEKPAIVVLLDADSAGDRARSELKKAGPKRKPIIDDALVLQYQDQSLAEIQTSNPAGCVAIEDLVPLNIAIDAAARFCREFVPEVDVSTYDLSAEAIFPKGAEDGKKGLLDALQTALRQASGNPTFELAKVGFARSVTEILLDGGQGAGRTTSEDVAEARENFRILLGRLSTLERQARRDKAVSRISSKINRLKREFGRTHPKVAKREDVLGLIEDIEAQLDTSVEADRVRESMSQWRESFKLSDDPTEDVKEYDELIAAINSVAYQSVRESEVGANASVGAPSPSA
jgi:predicted ATPase